MKFILDSKFFFKIYSSTAEFPDNWDIIANKNIFLKSAYLVILEIAAPKNMSCNFIGIFKNDILVGIGLSQFIDLNMLELFGERDKSIKTSVRNFIFKKLSSNVLFMGNNMLTGKNAYAFSDEINEIQCLKILKLALTAIKANLKSKGNKVHITTFKDFNTEGVKHFSIPEFKNQFRFSPQPNMIFKIDRNWKTDQDYINALTKKYRDQYKRARKKAEGIIKRKMNLEDIITHEDTIYDLYFHIAKNAPFNTFFLTKNHFRVLKKQLKDQFLFYGYFLDGKLIGFNTLVKNGEVMDTYFLGYDDSIQREKMLYLNMLYDMIAYSINKGFKEIIFGRTALEIKNSVGAIPHETFAFMEHSNKLINNKLVCIFHYLEPQSTWPQRNPFKG